MLVEMGNEVPISGIKKRGFLDEIAQGAKKSASTLADAIRATKSAIGSQPNFQRGKILVSTSGSGQSGSFEISRGEWQQPEVFAMCQQFIEVLADTMTAYALPDSGVPSDTDALVAQMNQDDRLRGVRSQMGDFSGLNYPATSLR